MIRMSVREKARLFQKVKSLTQKQFFELFDSVSTDAYMTGKQHMREAMEINPKIYKPTLEKVLLDADRIRSEWDGIHYVDELKMTGSINS